jgi:hypothetical protein
MDRFVDSISLIFQNDSIARGYTLFLIYARQCGSVSEDPTARVRPPYLAVFCEVVSLASRLVHMSPSLTRFSHYVLVAL